MNTQAFSTTDIFLKFNLKCIYSIHPSINQYIQYLLFCAVVSALFSVLTVIYCFVLLLFYFILFHCCLNLTDVTV